VYAAPAGCFYLYKEEGGVSEADSGGKKVGVFGSLIAAIGLLLSKGADDCARIGATGASAVGRSAPLADDALRAAGHAAPLADDGLRAAGHGASFADDGLRAAGRGAPFAEDGLRIPGRGAPLADDGLRTAGRTPPALADDGVLAAERGAPILEDSALGASKGGSPAMDVAETGFDIVTNTADLVDLSQGFADAYGESGDEGTAGLLALAKRDPELFANQATLRAHARADVESPAMIALLPTTREDFKRAIGRAPASSELTEIEHIAARSSEPPEVAGAGKPALFSALRRHRDTNPLVIIGYTNTKNNKGDSAALALPGGGEVRDAEIHRACLASEMNCVVLVCDAASPAEAALCANAAYRAWLTPTIEATKARSMSLEKYIDGMVVDQRNNAGGRGLLMSRVDIDDQGLARTLVRIRTRSGAKSPASR
jgi:hypothetical protein